jgi:dipeptidase D
MGIFDILWPGPLWNYFQEICKIPRLSKNEEKIRHFLLHFAFEHNLEAKEDSTGNILIIRPASPGMEDRKVLVLQSHMDMVGEKNSEITHDWNTDPVEPVIKDEWVTANGTTLGADDGMGIAAQMAVLTDKDLIAGKIECLFTVDEETGMTGAVNLSNDFFSGRTLVNLDSEDEGIIYIGCAGGLDTIGTLKYNPQPVDKDSSALELAVTGLHGGHSGDEIHKEHGNAVKIMNRLIRELANRFDIAIASIDGGNLRNAIPREAFATVVVKNSLAEKAKELVGNFFDVLINEIGSFELELKITVRDAPLPPEVMDRISQVKLIDAVESCPHGVIAWSREIEDLVETSTNLASVKFSDGNTIKIVSTQRSSVDASKKAIAMEVESVLRIAGAEVTHSEGYPGWEPNLNSPVLSLAQRSYKKLFGIDPQVKAIHAGLECGLIYEKFDGIDMISIGPTIKGAHTPAEKVEIKSVQKFWDLLIDIIKSMPPEK